MLRLRWLPLLLSITSTVLCSRLLEESDLKDTGSTDEVIPCVETIARDFFKGKENVLIISEESFIGEELIRRIGTRFSVNLATRKNRIDFNTIQEYIVLADDSGEDPYEVVRNMSLNPRGRYVFVTRAKPDAILNAASKFWSSGFPDVIFVQGSNEGSATVLGYEVSSLYPSAKIRVLDQWEIGKFVNGSNLFPSKFTDMQKHPLKVTVANTQEMQPDIYVTRSEDGEVRISGVGSNLLNLFAGKHNFKVVVFEHFSYGQKKNGTWSGPAAELIRGDADLTFAGLIPAPVVIEDFEYSEFYRWDAFHFVTKSARRTVSWMSLFKPFSSTVWMCELFVLLATLCLVCIVREFHRLDIVEEYVKPINILMVVLNQSVSYPKTFRIRLAFSVLLLYAYLITTSYNSSLVDRLSKPNFGRNPKSLGELVKLNIEIGGVYTFKSLLGATGDPVDREIHDRFVNLTTRQFWTLLAEKDRAVTVYRTAAIRHNWRYRLNESMQAHVIEEPIIGIPFMYYMRKGHPYRDPLNNFISQIHSSGLIVKWMSDYNAIKVDKIRENETVVLTLDHFACVFIILVCGHIVSTLKFFHELYF